MKTLKNYLTESLNGINKNFIKEILDGSSRDFLTLDDFTSNDEFDDLIEETANIAVDYLNSNMTGSEIADTLFNKGKLCKELVKLGWSNEPCDHAGIWEWHPDKTTNYWTFELSLFGVRTDLCLNIESEYDEDKDRTEFYIELCQCDTKKCKPKTNTAMFCMDVYGNDLV